MNPWGVTRAVAWRTYRMLGPAEAVESTTTMLPQSSSGFEAATGFCKQHLSERTIFRR